MKIGEAVLANIMKDAAIFFDSLRKNPKFQEIQKKLEQARQPQLQCRKAFRISEKDLMPEGIAYDPKEKAFFIGSTYKSKIIKISQEGKMSNFTKEKQDGLRSVLWNN